MADVRALLRNERLARRINHPNASYSTAGTLSCNVCNLRLQAESLWEPHLAGKVHKQNMQRIQNTSRIEIQPTSQTVPQDQNLTPSLPQTSSQSLSNGVATGKKRKAADSESDEEVSRDNSLRKKAKPMPRSGLPADFFDAKTKEVQAMDIGNGDDDTGQVTTRPSGGQSQISGNKTAIDEDEYAAFEAAIAAAPADDKEADEITRNVLHAGADIAAAPVTAAELATMDAEDFNGQRKGRKEEEMEGEKEDAARALEEEFDEMDQLEARVQKLRDMRERLRAAEGNDAAIDEPVNEEQPKPNVNEISDDDDDDYDDDDWGFR